jgi:hypothetical protein
VLTALVRWAAGVVTSAVRRLHSAVRTTTRPTSVFVGLVEGAFRSREELIAENALLRQQLIVTARSTARPRFKPHERGLMASLA